MKEMITEMQKNLHQLERRDIIQKYSSAWLKATRLTDVSVTWTAMIDELKRIDIKTMTNNRARWEIVITEEQICGSPTMWLKLRKL